MTRHNSKSITPVSSDDAIHGLAVQAAKVVSSPGVYLFKNSQGRILYVGKARNLRKRVMSYFQRRRPHDPKTRMMLKQVVRLETLVTHTEKEALILESNLIKRHRPRYNVVLKDDKRYPALRLDLRQTFPNLNIVRKIKNDGAMYFGPYSSAGAVRQTLKFIHKTFKLRKCHNRTFAGRTRPCLNYQMGLCLGPCCNEVDPGTYQSIVKEVIAFLRGRTPALINDIKDQMQQAAQEQNFEKAASLRDKMFALEKTLERQVTVTSDLRDRDVVALKVTEDLSAVALLKVRGGFLMGGRQYLFDNAVGTEAEQLGVFLHQLYGGVQRVPGQILVNLMPEDATALAAWLKELRGARVTLDQPMRGEKARLTQMAVQNAHKAISEKLEMDRANVMMLDRLQKRLHMGDVPRRIECFDNSNLGGKNPVAAMAVFEMGQPQPKENRRYRIQWKGPQDDYAYMAEVLKRRFGKQEDSKPWPDLLLVDGGKGQLNVALAVLDALGIRNQFAVAGIAKKDEALGETADKIFLPGRSNPIQFGKEMNLLLFLQRIRDEAHRLAVTYQRKRRGKQGLESTLDRITGIGPKRKALLLKNYGSLRDMAAASEEELAQLPGITIPLARTLKKTLLFEKT